MITYMNLITLSKFCRVLRSLILVHDIFLDKKNKSGSKNVILLKPIIINNIKKGTRL